LPACVILRCIATVEFPEAVCAVQEAAEPTSGISCDEGLCDDGDVDIAKSVLRDYVNATIGFPARAEATGMPPKNLMRMLGPKGNPTAVNLFGVIAALQDKTGVHIEVRAVADAA
jgi:hypothetical protein